MQHVRNLLRLPKTNVLAYFFAPLPLVDGVLAFFLGGPASSLYEHGKKIIKLAIRYGIIDYSQNCAISRNIEFQKSFDWKFTESCLCIHTFSAIKHKKNICQNVFMHVL